MVAVKNNVGVVYGNHGMDKETVSVFIAWLIRNGAEAGIILQQHKIGSCEFNACWLDIEELMGNMFDVLQNKFMEECINDE